MNFKKPKHAVLSDARYRAQSMFKSHLQNNMPHLDFNRSGMIDAITQAFSYAMADALESFMDNIYTDAEFEEDLTLRPKS